MLRHRTVDPNMDDRAAFGTYKRFLIRKYGKTNTNMTTILGGDAQAMTVDLREYVNQFRTSQQKKEVQ